MRTLLLCLTVIVLCQLGIRPVRSHSTNVTSMPLGIVEGFHGKRWTREERLSMIAFMRERNMTEYCYAPKDDPYHREKWRDPYPPEKFAELKEVIDICRNLGITFRFAISPGSDT